MVKFLGFVVVLGVSFWGGMYWVENHRSSTAAHTAASAVGSAVAKTANAVSSAASSASTKGK